MITRNGSKEKKEEALKNGKLNPVDILIISQISPGELSGIENSLEFAKDLVSEWLEKRKFKNWKTRKSTGTPVTDEQRIARAKKIADMFANHTTWRTHGRSLKIEDLQNDLEIERIDDDANLSEIVHRIHTIIRLMFDSSSIYKLYYLDDFKLSRTSVVANTNQLQPPGSNVKKPQHEVEGIGIDVQCPRCKKIHQILGYFNVTSEIIQKLKIKTNNNINGNDNLICDQCQYSIDLKPIKNDFENKTRKTLTFK